ncbi:TraB/GumN family protein [Salisediminibacterium selenitireducens]|uniref:GumN family protein n=1 Tax=Bacillus selenitireducens (strain ATCC 700615 / DSM 15326 / MLS10) TaxID=439292 RepID=D6XUQ9_BACIE|nr:TraB/GumN family protein [Salisediminibacterium selenitireducens]ADH99545.1 GumN family protein [[Bacillus] selenitireducens MLS10]
MMNRLIFAAAFTGLLFVSACQADEESELHFEDSELEQAVADALDTDLPIDSELAGDVTELETDLQINSLEGIAQLHALDELHIDSSQIDSYEPLLSLDNLQVVSLGDLYFTDDTERNEETERVLEVLEDREVELDFRTRLSISDRDGDSKGLFYEVTHNEQQVYLFGSIHVGDDHLYPIREEVMDAFYNADSLSVELDINQIDEMALSQQMMNTGMLSEDETLSDFITDDMIEDVTQYLSQLMIPEPMITQFEPWFLTMLLNDYAQMQSDYTSEGGIDQYFINLAESDDLPIMELESAEDQISAIAGAPMDEQIDGLQGALDTMDIYEEELTQMMNLWRSGNREIFEQLRAYDSEYGSQMMNERDQQMTEVIESYLNSDSGDHYFVVVGALHLAGENSIPYLLEDKGYDVELIE